MSFIYKRTTSTALLLTAILFTTMVQPLFAADLIVKVATVEEAKGTIMLAIYDSESTFSKTATTGANDAAIKGEMIFSFSDLAAGDYAVMVYHDINGNGELDSNMLGMPKEPWGGSLQGKQLFGAPKWSDAQFKLTDSGMSLIITLN